MLFEASLTFEMDVYDRVEWLRLELCLAFTAGTVLLF